MTIDYSRQGRASRRKGARGELQVRDVLREHGHLRAHRNHMSGGAGGGDLADAIPDVHLEVKFVKRLDLHSAWRQADAAKRPTDSILIAHKGDNQPWLGTMLLTDIIGWGSFHWSPLAISSRQSVRAEFLGRLRLHLHPLVVHMVAGECVATGLLDDVLTVMEPLA